MGLMLDIILKKVEEKCKQLKISQLILRSNESLDKISNSIN